MSSVAEALLKERDAAYAERDLHIRAGELMAQEIEKLTAQVAALEWFSEVSAEQAMAAFAKVTPKGNPE